MRTSAASEHRLDRPVSRHWWLIVVEGYGKFAFYGTADEADEMRAHKAAWERSVATMRRVTESNLDVRRQIEWVRNVEIPRGYPRGSEREQAETAVIMAANSNSTP